MASKRGTAYFFSRKSRMRKAMTPMMISA